MELSTQAEERLSKSGRDAMFASIAARYDLVNTIQSCGLDRWLRRRAAAGARGRVILDVGAGSGALTAACIRAGAERVVCLDRSMPMLRLAAKRTRYAGGGKVAVVCGDADAPPFKEGAFDGVVSGYLLRNLPDVSRALRALYGVLKPGGVLIALDLLRPPRNIWGWGFSLYLRWVVPVIGGIITGNGDAYRYLAGSIAKCFTVSDFARWVEEAGYGRPTVRRFLGGVVVLIWATKRANA